MDRLGRNAMDVRAWVETLAERGAKVPCLAMGGVDLTRSTGRDKLGERASVPKLSRDYGVSRQTIQRARDEGKARADADVSKGGMEASA